MKLAIKITLLNLLIVAATGCLMRLLPLLPSQGIEFENLRHAHSHLAFLGWVYSAFFLGLVRWFLPAGSFEKGRYDRLFWLNQASLAGMFIAFLLNGYAAVSIAFLTAHTLLAYIFIARFLKDWKPEAGVVSSGFIKMALLSFFLSSLAPFAIPFIQIFNGGSPVWMKTAIHFYLHFQYNGWFIFALLALFLKGMGSNGVQFSAMLVRWLLAALALALLPTFFANLSFFKFSPAANVGMLAAASIQWGMATIFLLHAFWKMSVEALVFNGLQKLFLRFSLVCLWLKMTCQVLALLPGAAAIFDLSNLYLTLGYLHLLFLGSVTTFLFWLFSRETTGGGSSKWAVVGGGIFLVGFGGSEAALFLAGLGFVLPDLPVVLLIFSIGLLAGIGLLTCEFFRKGSQRKEITPRPALRNFVPLRSLRETRLLQKNQA